MSVIDWPLVWSWTPLFLSALGLTICGLTWGRCTVRKRHQWSDWWAEADTWRRRCDICGSNDYEQMGSEEPWAEPAEHSPDTSPLAAPVLPPLVLRETGTREIPTVSIGVPPSTERQGPRHAASNRGLWSTAT